MSICLNTIPAIPPLNREGKLFPVWHDLFAAFAHNDRIRWPILYRCSASRRHKLIREYLTGSGSIAKVAIAPQSASETEGRYWSP